MDEMKIPLFPNIISKVMIRVRQVVKSSISLDCKGNDILLLKLVTHIGMSLVDDVGDMPSIGGKH